MSQLGNFFLNIVNWKILYFKNLIGCQCFNLFLLKNFTITSITITTLRFCPKFILWVLSQLYFLKFCHNLSFRVLSQFEFLIFVTIFLCVVAILFFQLSQFQFLSFVKISVFEFCNNFSFSILSQIEFLSLVTISVCEFCHYLNFVSFVTILVFCV